jgi:predicted dehydrogenase
MVGGGTGAFIGAVHRTAARLDDRFELVAAALSSDPERSLAAASELHIPRAYASFAQMAREEARRDDPIDAVAIVTPNHLHHAVAKAFLEVGIHVICDKPLTTTLDDALDLSDTVQRTGLIFGLTHTYVGYPLVRQAREMVLAGELGAVRMGKTGFRRRSKTLDRSKPTGGPTLRAVALRGVLETSGRMRFTLRALPPAYAARNSLRI